MSDLTQSEREAGEAEREKRPKGLTEGHRGDNDGRQRVRSPARTPPPPPPPSPGPEGDAKDQTSISSGQETHTKQTSRRGVAS